MPFSVHCRYQPDAIRSQTAALHHPLHRKRHSAIKYTEGTLNLNSEVYVAWCIDDVDTVLKCASLRLCLFLRVQ